MVIDKLLFLILVLSISGVIHRGVPIFSLVGWPAYKLIVVIISTSYFVRLFTKSFRKSTPVKYYTLFLLICIIWMAFNYTHSGLSSFSALLAGLMPFFPGYFLLRQNKISERLVTSSLLLFFLVAILSYYGYAQMLKDNFGDRDITNNIGYYFVSIISIIYLFRRKLWSYVIIILVVFYVFSSAKRGAIVCTLAALLIYYYYISFLSKKVTFSKIAALGAYSALLVVLYAYFFAEDTYTSQRIYESFNNQDKLVIYSGRDAIYASLWQIFINSGLFHLLFGYGPDATVNLIGIHAHNDWLEILIDYGLIGSIIYLSFFIATFFYIKKLKTSKYKYMVVTIISVLLLQTFFSMGFTSLSMSITSFILGCSIGKLDNLNNLFRKKKEIIVQH